MEKAMKKSLGILLVVLFLTAGNALAHCGKCGMGDDSGMDMKAMAEEKVGKMAKDLSLNDEQKSRVAAIVKEKMEKKHAIMNEKHKAMDDLHEEYKGKLKEVLNEEQLKKWEKKKYGVEGKCPMCIDGKMCKKCKIKKDREGKSKK